MKQTIDIRSGDVHRFNAGQAGRFLIIRESSQSVILRGDNMRPLEIERGDTIDVSQFDELEIVNHNKTSVYLEYQVADVEVRIKSHSTNVDGALDIAEIHAPVVISRIQEPIDVSVSIPSVSVDMPDSFAISNFPSVQNVNIVGPAEKALRFLPMETMVTSGTVVGRVSRKELILKAADDNSASIWLGGVENKGFELVPGMGFVLTNGASVDVFIPSGAKLYLSEVTA